MLHSTKSSTLHPSHTDISHNLHIFNIPYEHMITILSYVTIGVTVPISCRLTCKLFNELSDSSRQLRLHEINYKILTAQYNWRLVQASNQQYELRQLEVTSPTLQSVELLTLNQRNSSISSIDEDIHTAPYSTQSTTLFHSLANAFKRAVSPQHTYIQSPSAQSTSAYEYIDTAPKLHAHNSVVVNHTVYVYAGSSKQFDIRGSNELYSYNINTKIWKRMLCADKPSPRTFAPIVYNSCTHTLHTFGGQDRNAAGKWTFYNNVYRYDIITNTWAQQLITTQLQPCARVGHRMLVIPNTDKFILFGGCYCTDSLNGTVASTAPQYTYLNDMWSFDMMTSQWTSHELTGDIPSARHSYEMCLLPYVDNDNNTIPYVFLFGGNSNVYSSSNLNDTYIININTMHCTRLNMSCQVPHYNTAHEYTHTAVRDDLPSGRWASNMIVLSDYILLFGGYRSQNTPSDFSLNHIYTCNWKSLLQHNTSHNSQLSSPHQYYWTRSRVFNSVITRTFSSSFVVDNSHVYLYGGANKGIPLNEMLQLI